MARRWVYSGQEVFVGDELRWDKASVVHDEARRTLQIKAKENGSPLAVRLALTDVEATGLEKIGRERHRTFTGLDAEDGFTLVTIVKQGCACGS